MTVPGEVMWARMSCGLCGSGFTADPGTVPVLTGKPWCLKCWNTRNTLRIQAGMEPDERPDAYPEDYPTGEPS